MTSKALTRLLYILSKEHKDPDIILDQFLKFVQHKNMLYRLPTVIRRLEQMAKLKHHETRIRLRVPERISEAAESDIRKFIGAGGEVGIEQVIDSALTGGFVAEYDNVLYDGSVDRQLRKLQELLSRD